MFIEEVDLFRGFGPDLMGELSRAAKEISCPANQVLFKRGDPAEAMYILQNGRVNLYVEDQGSINFLVDRQGEVIGWSALVEPNIYTASAGCYDDCRLLALDRMALEHIFDRFPREACQVMKRLAGVVARRLMGSYDVILRSRNDSAAPSYG